MEATCKPVASGKVYRSQCSKVWSDKGFVPYIVTVDGTKFAEGAVKDVNTLVATEIGDNDLYEEADEGGQVYCKLTGKAFKALIKELRAVKKKVE